MRIALTIVGVLLIILGLHWIGQGTGTFIWPANPVMDNNITWAYYGGVAVVAGIVVLLLGRRA